MEMLSEPADVNQMYDEALHNLKTRKPASKPSLGTSNAEKEQNAKDYYANVRTNVSLISLASLASLNHILQVLLAWVLSNVSCIVSSTQSGSDCSLCMQGLLLLGILGAGGAGDTFSQDTKGPNTTKIYLTFILAFVGITSSIVSYSFSCCRIFR